MKHIICVGLYLASAAHAADTYLCSQLNQKLNSHTARA